MTDKIRLWEISEGEKITEIHQEKLNLEERLETWLEKDISLLSSGILVIGRQVETDYGGLIDLLGIDGNGNLLVIELKRDRTPREVTAQALDYASWVKDLSYDRVKEIADRYLLKQNSSLEKAFTLKFNQALPETLNEQHQILIVASQIDSSTERIIKYLSEYGLQINVVTFQYFRDSNAKEFMARKFLIEPDIIINFPGKRKTKTYTELETEAENNGVGELYNKLCQGLTPQIFWTTTTRSSITFTGTGTNKRAIFGLLPGQSNPDEGLKFKVYVTRLAEFLSIEQQNVNNLLPTLTNSWEEEWSGLVGEGFFKTEAEVNHFLTQLNEVRRELR
ncbi:MAG: endonuclease NucS domain-containing protein [Phormidium sp.]